MILSLIEIAGMYYRLHLDLKVWNKGPDLYFTPYYYAMLDKEICPLTKSDHLSSMVSLLPELFRSEPILFHGFMCEVSDDFNVCDLLKGLE